MKNKSSYRLIAWLLALIMVFNIMPLSAIAEDARVSAESNEEDSPGLGSENGLLVISDLGTETAPNEIAQSFKVQYVIKAEYTYGGSNNLLLSSYTKTVSSENPSTIQPDSIPGCTVDGNSRKWDSVNKVLTFYPVPIQGQYLIHYRYIGIINNAWSVQTFQS